MTIKEMIDFRHTIKQYDKTKSIPEDQWKQILDYGLSSPSSMNWSPWRVLVVDRNSKMANQLSEKQLYINHHHVLEGHKTMFYVVQNQKSWEDGKFYEKSIRNNMVLTALKAGEVKGPNDFSEEEYAAAKENTDWFVGMMNLTDKLDEWAKRQTYIGMGMMTAAASMLKVDTTILEGFHPQEINKIFREMNLISEKESVVVVEIFGYRIDDTAFNPTNRDSLEYKFNEVD